MSPALEYDATPLAVKNEAILATEAAAEKLRAFDFVTENIDRNG